MQISDEERALRGATLDIAGSIVPGKLRFDNELGVHVASEVKKRTDEPTKLYGVFYMWVNNRKYRVKIEPV